MPRTALVTGGTRGIGAAIARSLKEAGHTVAATYAGNTEKAEAFRRETGIEVFRWDVADPQACEAGVREVEAALGPVDILVNNAGITRDGWFHKMDYDAWSAVLRTNLDSMFTMTKPVIDGMRERGFGRVVNISSVNGQKGQIGQVNYSAAKAGVIGFTKALALENARKGVTVNCICPGYIDTDMVAAVPEKVLEGIIAGVPLNRLGKAEEIGALVVYLVSEPAAYMTGAVLSINGGQYMANG
ncbi:acetoacetyl-CoA reductase [Faunimonas sp. B44]|uniref:acetoacetyl-CoA reductase n=1 Tax=Faunimonas sp. B44 TaxID=3461493 RepID=UPI0040449751